jgi:hypothetical protein
MDGRLPAAVSAVDSGRPASTRPLPVPAGLHETAQHDRERKYGADTQCDSKRAIRQPAEVGPCHPDHGTPHEQPRQRGQAVEAFQDAHRRT